MKTLRHLLVLMLCTALLPLASAHAETADINDADTKTVEREALVKHMANMTLAILQDQKKAFADREATMQRGIASMVDTDWIARFALGNAWKTATDAQRERYTKLYGRYLTKMYISNFAQSRERKIRDINILGIADSQENSFVARTEVLLAPEGRIHVDYLVREHDNSRKIIDITIEGVSLLTTHRAQFSQMAAEKGVDGVIAQLETLVKADVPPMALSMK